MVERGELTVGAWATIAAPMPAHGRRGVQWRNVPERYFLADLR
ncbi:MAG TPA: hypothetical protein VF792_10795 [Ktedonobacterales bacterium]